MCPGVALMIHNWKHKKVKRVHIHTVGSLQMPLVMAALTVEMVTVL